MKGTRRQLITFLAAVVGGLAVIANAFDPLRSGDSKETNGTNDSEGSEKSENIDELENSGAVEETSTELSLSFRNWDWIEQFSEEDPIGNVSLSSDPAYETRSLSVEIPENSNYGTSLHYLFSEETSSEPEELWASYYVYFPDSFNGENQVGKLPGPAGTYDNGGWGGRRSNGTNGWSARMGFRGSGPDEVGLDYYVYHADMDGNFGDFFQWDRNVTKGEWNRIDQYILLNDPGEKNGVLMGWVDGNEAYARRDIKFRETSELKIEDYWFTVYWGGMYPSPADNRILFDNLTVRTKERS